MQLLWQVGVHDQGRIINPKLVEGQHHGALAQGIGQAMAEAITYDADGQPVGSTFMDCTIPVAEDLPMPSLDNLEFPSPTDPLGAKGAGEIATTGTAGVIVNAVVDALSPFGVRHIETPVTPEKIWRIIHEGSAGQS